MLHAVFVCFFFYCIFYLIVVIVCKMMAVATAELFDARIIAKINAVIVNNNNISLSQTKFKPTLMIRLLCLSFSPLQTSRFQIMILFLFFFQHQTNAYEHLDWMLLFYSFFLSFVFVFLWEFNAGHNRLRMCLWISMKKKQQKRKHVKRF